MDARSSQLAVQAVGSVQAGEELIACWRSAAHTGPVVEGSVEQPTASPAAARAKATKARKLVERRQRETMAVLAKSL